MQSNIRIPFRQVNQLSFQMFGVYFRQTADNAGRKFAFVATSDKGVNVRIFSPMIGIGAVFFS